ncbi:MAG: YgjP-like metallopeptidase domain-containing protein [Eubacterium sp.]
MIKGQKITPEHKKIYRYETGEKHKYLGHFYTLSTIQTNNEPLVTLQGENLILEVNDPKNLKQKELVLDLWYREKAREVFVPILAECLIKAAPYSVKMPNLRIYKMLDRWGSCSPKSKILILNLDLIKVPKLCIEYIALHEVIHFKYPSHDFGFYSALGNLMPNWKEREDFLNTYYPI